MQGIVFIIRLTLAVIAFFYLVVFWAWLPLVEPERDMNITVVTVFFGTTTPIGWVRDLLLVSRGFFGLMVTMFIFVPALRFFFDFTDAIYNNTIAIVLAGASVVAFFAALLTHHLFYI